MNNIRVYVGYSYPSFLLKGKYFTPLWCGKKIGFTNFKDDICNNKQNLDWMELNW